jgi:arylsulfatase A-like enzyme/Tfp pilus assembly protein PilF
LAMRFDIFWVMAKWIGIGAVIAVVVILVVVLGRGPGEYNVLLISIDTLRPDHLGCYGYEDIATPNIDRLADRSYLFLDAIGTVPLTLPSHTSILTGLLPVSHGVRDNATFALSEQFLTLAEVFSEHDYTTSAFVAAFVMDSRFGLDQGFQTYSDEMESGGEKSAFSWPERRAEAVNDTALKWFRKARQPFFAFVHYYDPHDPYDPPEPFASVYAGNRYDGEIAYTDSILGNLFKALKKRDLYDNTLIVLVSDHGEGLKQHDESGHGVLIYESTVRVALMIKPPKGYDLGDFETNRRIAYPVQLIDVFPTILDMLGIEYGHEVDGVSLLPIMRGDRIEPRMLYMESLYAYFYFRWSQLRGLRHNNWKYILAPEEELYDLAADPEERNNLATSQPERVAEMRGHLNRIAARETEALEATRESLTQEEVHKLMALGYLAGGRPELPENLEPEGHDPKYMMKDLDTYLSGGRDLFDLGKFDEAAGMFGKLVLMDPGNPQAHVHLAKALVELGELDIAEAEFKKAIEIDSTHSGAFFPMATMLREKGDLDRALFYLRLGANLSMETSDVLSSMGAIYVEKGEPDSAILVLEKALEIDPRDPMALQNMGQAYLSKKQPEKAAHWFRATLEVEPHNVKVLGNMARIFIERGQPDSTIYYFELAREANPEDPSLLANLGSAYRQKGMVEQAGEAYEAALQYQPDNVMAMFGLAAVRAQQGRTEDAIVLLERILEIDPEFQAALRALQTLR